MIYCRFKAAQPALLYLVPACIGAPLLLAVCRGEVSTLFNYSEKQFVKQDDNDEKEKKKNN
jgi:minor histocompatibility antigen H13